MSQLIAALLFFGLVSLGSDISSGLQKLGDSILIANGYKESCSGPWYERKCEWVKSGGVS